MDNLKSDELLVYFFHNYNGVLVKQGTTKFRENIHLNLKSGIYIVQINTENAWYTEKLVIQ